MGSSGINAGVHGGCALLSVSAEAHLRMAFRLPLAILVVAVFVYADDVAEQTNGKLASRIHQLESRMQLMEDKVVDETSKTDPIFHPNPLKMHLQPESLKKQTVQPEPAKKQTVQIQTKLQTKSKSSSRRRGRVVVIHTSRRRYYGGHVYVTSGSG